MEGGRILAIDHTGNARRFATKARSLGYNQIADEDLFDLVTITVASDAKSVKQFWKAADPGDKTKRSTSPAITYGQPFGDVCLGIYGIKLEWDQLRYSGTVLEGDIATSILSDCYLEVKGNGQPILSKRVGELLAGRPGRSVSLNGTDQYKGPIVSGSVGFMLTNWAGLSKDSSISADLTMPQVISGTDNDIDVRLVLNALVARKGAVGSMDLAA
jgi:hypothetical protein